MVNWKNKIRKLFSAYIESNIVKGEPHPFLPGVVLSVTLSVTLDEQKKHFNELWAKYATNEAKYELVIDNEEIVNFIDK